MRLATVVIAVFSSILLSAFASGGTINVVPKPMQVESRSGFFEIKSSIRIIVDEASQPAVQFLVAKLAAVGVTVHTEIGNRDIAGEFSVRVSTDLGLGDEGYQLDVSPDRVQIRGGGPAGIFYAIQTIRQLLPPQFENGRPADGIQWRIPCVKIVDKPRFPWRGLMLDPARHFLEPPLVLKIIDVMSYYKLNRLHLHLTDSEGWRIEIHKYPELTDVNNWPQSAKSRGVGFYTQEQMRAIIQYASARNIEIIPEFDLPCHSALASYMYPDLLCPNNPLRSHDPAQWNDGSWYRSEMCACSDNAFQIMTGILAELTDLFPGQFIHIGGDESMGTTWAMCPQCQKRIKDLNLDKEDNPQLVELFKNADGDKKRYLLYRDLMRRVAQFVVQRGKTPILWDDLSWQGKTPPGAAIMQWHYKGGQDFFVHTIVPTNPTADAAINGHDAIVCPFSNLYFDLPGNLSTVYNFEPMPEGLTPEQQKHVLGPQADNWDCPPEKLQERLFPKLLALSEIAWSAKDQHNFSDFSERLVEQYQRLDSLGVDYQHDPRVGSIKLGSWKPSKSNSMSIDCDATETIKHSGDYIVTPLYDKGPDAVKILSIALLEDGKVISSDTHQGQTGFSNVDNSYKVSLAKFKTNSKYSIQIKLAGVPELDSYGSIYLK